MNTERLMTEAIALAETGRGKTSPNPFVGCLIVRSGEVIARGVTQKCGSDHAEVQALKQAGEQARGAEMYVTLEPCCFVGRTPACSKAIIKAGIKKVYVGIIDPNPRVNGQGIAELREAGIEVESGIHESEIRKQLEYYLLNQRLKRPFVMMKSAMTLDGCIAGIDGSSKWITGEASRRRVHQLRSEADAVITGIGTVLFDDPQFNNRVESNCRQPLRVILDRELKLPLDSKIVQTANEQKTLVFSCTEGEKAEKLRACGVDVISFKEETIQPLAVLQVLHEREISVVLLEAGSRINSSFERAGLIDKYLLFIAPMILGNGKRVFSLNEKKNMSEIHSLQFASFKTYGKDILIEAYPEKKLLY